MSSKKRRKTRAHHGPGPSRRLGRRDQRRRAPRRERPVWSLLRKTLSSYWSSLPAFAAVVLVVAIPSQLVLAWILQRQGVESTFWHMQYQGAAEWVVGSLIVSSLYVTIHASIRNEAPQGLGSVVIWAYRRGVRAWPGMFMTRLMVSFVVGVASLPALLGVWGVTQLWPGLGRLLSSPERLEQSSPIEFAPLLLVIPLFALPLAIYLRYALTEAVVSIERRDGFEALQRSRTLTHGVRWQMLLCLLPLEIPIQALQFGVLGAAPELGPYLTAMITTFIMVLAALTGTLLVHIYRKQGGDGSPRRDGPDDNGPN